MIMTVAPMHHMKLVERAPTKDPFEGIATVKKVLDHALLADGTCEYRVCWSDSSEDWVPERDFVDHACLRRYWATRE